MVSCYSPVPRCASRLTVAGLLLALVVLLAGPTAVLAGEINTGITSMSDLTPSASSALVVVNTPPALAESTPLHPSKEVAVSGFAEAFASTWAMILVSELGDKTFFIAAIMAMSHPRLDVFLSASAALFFMTVLSVGLGVALPTLLPRAYTHWASCLLFLVFGVKLLYSAVMGEDEEENEELKEVEEELAAAAATAGSDSSGATSPVSPGSAPMGTRMAASVTSPSASGRGGLDDDEEAALGGEKQALTAGSKRSNSRTPSEALRKGQATGPLSSLRLLGRKLVTPVMMQCFTMTFLAEWGDRSQISTIALAASKNAVGVAVGGIVGHAICTGLAVVGGKLLASRISERAVNAIGGVLFVVFAAWGVAMGPE